MGCRRSGTGVRGRGGENNSTKVKAKGAARNPSAKTKALLQGSSKDEIEGLFRGLDGVIGFADSLERFKRRPRPVDEVDSSAPRSSSTL